MKGSELKEILRKEGVILFQLAEDLGMSQQNLSAAFTRDDVKSGLLEKIAKSIGRPVGFFYGECPTQTATGNNNTQVAGNSNTVNCPDSAIMELLKIKDEQLLLAMRQTSTAQEHTSKAQEQMDRLLDKIVGK